VQFASICYYSANANSNSNSNNLYCNCFLLALSVVSLFSLCHSVLKYCKPSSQITLTHSHTHTLTPLSTTPDSLTASSGSGFKTDSDHDRSDHRTTSDPQRPSTSQSLLSRSMASPDPMKGGLDSPGMGMSNSVDMWMEEGDDEASYSSHHSYGCVFEVIEYD
jgi:hypothetical protein